MLFALLNIAQEYAMSATQRPQQSDDQDDKFMDGQEPHIPDEDGPHDVPDDKVIEKTLPSSPSPERTRST
ncbi:hypothetical protein GCM10027034_14680 [Ramlibacter solisilvae]|uniref:Uncharacterized protein n=1 Tax=Ramlibacter tataouinensis TaxID=94132 RepID=A0A127JWN6_9BURK|nr:hypothetical protein [Ramlibacter tataouinensis]AMO24315.1 hypothetical protein UC35_17530 [Ramlibacter tataouinensis]